MKTQYPQKPLPWGNNQQQGGILTRGPSTDSPTLGHSEKQRYKGYQTIQEGKTFIKSSSVGTNKEFSKFVGYTINTRKVLLFYRLIINYLNKSRKEPHLKFKNHCSTQNQRNLLCLRLLNRHESQSLQEDLCSLRLSMMLRISLLITLSLVSAKKPLIQAYMK